MEVHNIKLIADGQRFLMKIQLSVPQLTSLGMSEHAATLLAEKLAIVFKTHVNPEKAWQFISQNILSDTQYPFAIHLYLFNLLFPNWHSKPESAPAWIPDEQIKTSANIASFMRNRNFADVKTLHRWTVIHFESFWQSVIEILNIHFQQSPQAICDLTQGVESPNWLPGARMNIAESCFQADPTATALLYGDNYTIKAMNYGELNKLSNRVANSLIAQGLKRGDGIAIIMPMNQYAVAIYLGIIKIGAAVVSIADSFASNEIAQRLKVANAKLIFTQDYLAWSDKQLPLYEKVKEIENAPTTIVLPKQPSLSISLRQQDLNWEQFILNVDTFKAIACEPMDACNILFSSGTTAIPKAIPWNHTTPIKVASDAYFHQNIQKGDVLCWPTNLGWMMGPWLVFAALMNRATIALYEGSSPKERGFGEFIQQTKVTMLGVVPTLVSAWRQSGCMENLDWHAIKVFSSSGECSNPEDMLYLTSLAHYKPIIEYCGGTEIGGGFVTSTVIENNYPSLFSTKAMGSDFIILDEQSDAHANTGPARAYAGCEVGEIALVPPSIGLSTQLLNADHHAIYFANMPEVHEGKILRRHGDQIKRLSNGYYMLLGRVDDSMNLGGIKVSAAEIERILSGLPTITEVAAIAIPPESGGPNQLVIYAASTAKAPDKQTVIKIAQQRISTELNPLFKIHDVIFVKTLPKTASNKIMRRELRKSYIELFR